MISEAFAERCPEQPKTLGGYGKVVGQVECATPRRGIADEVQKLRELVAMAHDYVSALEEKTAPFRRALPQCADKEGTVPKSIGSALTEDISNQNERLSALCSRMAYLIDEIDL